jgi:hypothetical protein
VKVNPVRPAPSTGRSTRGSSPRRPGLPGVSSGAA